MKTKETSKVLKNLSYIYTFKILFKIIDSLITFYIIKNIDPSIYGITSIIYLITDIQKFYLLEVFKKTYIRRFSGNEKVDKIRSSKNIMILGILFTLVFSILISFIFLRIYDGIHPLFSMAVFLTIFETFFISIFEFFILKMILEMDYFILAVLEPFQGFLKTLFFFFFNYYGIFDVLLRFGYSNIFSFFFKFVFLIFFLKIKKIKILNFLPEKIFKVSGKYLNEKVFFCLKEFFILNSLKFIHERSEKFFIFFFLNSEILGNYTFLTNLTGIIVFNIFIPYETFFFNYFSKKFEKINSEKKDEKIKKHELKTIFYYSTRYFFYFNLIFFLYSFFLLKTKIIIPFLGKNYGNENFVNNLNLNISILPFMALNGITESFLYSTQKLKKMKILRFYNFFILIINFLLLAYFIQFGIKGIFLANFFSKVF